MAYRKKTLRELRPEAKKLAKLRGELQSITLRLKRIIEMVNFTEYEHEQLIRELTFKKKEKEAI